jgi:para-aminobenzoate synthetase/4-amino-4-deoxychorismate lyase
MRIIDELESGPRGVYTGAIGYLSGSDSVFNVAIRTVCIDRVTGTLEMGAGSGILHEAHAEHEYQECALKARFLSETHRPFRLLETLLWTPQQGFARLELHLDRILESAEYFLYPANRETLQKALTVASVTPLRVRLMLDERGKIEIQHEPIHSVPDRPHVCLARQPVNSADLFLFHKTTNRELYEEELSRARSRGFYDVIFRNERGEVTEGAISNLVLRKGNEYYTPPVECGLLPGTFRRHLFETRTVPISERVLTVRDLVEADAVFLTNALSGLLQVTFLA